jgi:hypothetical protein
MLTAQAAFVCELHLGLLNLPPELLALREQLLTILPQRIQLQAGASYLSTFPTCLAHIQHWYTQRHKAAPCTARKKKNLGRRDSTHLMGGPLLCLPKANAEGVSFFCCILLGSCEAAQGGELLALNITATGEAVPL